VTKFQIQSRMKAETAEWRMDIENDSDEIVRSFGGKGVPPQHVLWDGKDATGLPLPDGVYRYTIFVRDIDGREVTSRELTVEILTSGPSGSVPISVDPQ
jgi:flagellar hook assembly protein FlgD